MPLQFIYILCRDGHVEEPVWLDHAPTIEEYNLIWTEIFRQEGINIYEQWQRFLIRRPEATLTDAIDWLRTENDWDWRLFQIPKVI